MVQKAGGKNVFFGGGQNKIFGKKCEAVPKCEFGPRSSNSEKNRPLNNNNCKETTRPLIDVLYPHKEVPSPRKRSRIVKEIFRSHMTSNTKDERAIFRLACSLVVQ